VHFAVGNADKSGDIAVQVDEIVPEAGAITPSF